MKRVVHAQVEEGLEKEVKREVEKVEYALENDLSSFGKGFTVLEQVSLSFYSSYYNMLSCQRQGMSSAKL